MLSLSGKITTASNGNLASQCAILPLPMENIKRLMVLTQILKMRGLLISLEQSLLTFQEDSKMRNRVKNAFLFLISFIIMGIVFVAVIVFLWEGSHYLMRSKEHAETNARTSFYEECTKRRLVCADYVGPLYVGFFEEAYKFKWTNTVNADEILVSVFYGPFYSETSYISSEEKAIQDNYRGN